MKLQVGRNIISVKRCIRVNEEENRHCTDLIDADADYEEVTQTGSFPLIESSLRTTICDSEYLCDCSTHTKLCRDGAI